MRLNTFDVYNSLLPIKCKKSCGFFIDYLSLENNGYFIFENDAISNDYEISYTFRLPSNIYTGNLVDSEWLIFWSHYIQICLDIVGSTKSLFVVRPEFDLSNEILLDNNFFDIDLTITFDKNGGSLKAGEESYTLFENSNEVDEFIDYQHLCIGCSGDELGTANYFNGWIKEVKIKSADEEKLLKPYIDDKGITCLMDTKNNQLVYTKQGKANPIIENIL